MRRIMRIEILIKIIEEKKKDAFDEHLKWASEVVKSWPEWKRNVLGKCNYGTSNTETN